VRGDAGPDIEQSGLAALSAREASAPVVSTRSQPSTRASASAARSPKWQSSNWSSIMNSQMTQQVMSSSSSMPASGQVRAPSSE
jgi:hypothetical protein